MTDIRVDFYSFVHIVFQISVAYQSFYGWTDGLQTSSTAEKYSILFRRGQAPLETKRHLFRSPSGYQSRKQDTNQNGNGDSKIDTLLDSHAVPSCGTTANGKLHLRTTFENRFAHLKCWTGTDRLRILRITTRSPWQDDQDRSALDSRRHRRQTVSANRWGLRCR